MPKLSLLPRGLGLPDFPWDTLAAAKERAASHPDGIVDLSVGTPVDPTPYIIQDSLKQASDAPGYPLVVGTSRLNEAIGNWMERRGMITVAANGRIPTVGSKEMVTWLPLMLGVGPGDTVLIPATAYPTYEVSARIAGATAVPVDPTSVETWPTDATLVWLNSPSNPTGEVLSAEQLRVIINWARANGVVVASDECYAELAWEEPYLGPGARGVPSALHPQVCGEKPDGVLVLYSLSKQSNMAGYRGAVLVGDPNLVSATVEVRKHAGMMVPAPVQAAMVTAFEDEKHVAAQRLIYGRRRQALFEAVKKAGIEPYENSAAGLYLWVRAPKSAEGVRLTGRELVDWFASLGILVAPGDFYGTASKDFVRMALTATDERVESAVSRLSSGGAVSKSR